MGCYYFCQDFSAFEEIHIFVFIEFGAMHSVIVSQKILGFCLRIWPKLGILESRIMLFPTFWNSICILSAYNAFKSCLGNSLGFGTEQSINVFRFKSIRVIRCYHSHSLFKELTHLHEAKQYPRKFSHSCVD